jgi:hypothetical protein
LPLEITRTAKGSYRLPFAHYSPWLISSDR